MNPREARRPGRPRTSPHPRREQLRRAKRAQRERDRKAGLVLCQLKMRAATAARLRNALAVPTFEERLDAYLAEAIVDARNLLDQSLGTQHTQFGQYPRLVKGGINIRF